MSFYSRLFVALSPAAFVSAVLTTAMLCFAPAAFADRTAADDESHIDDPRVQHRRLFPMTARRPDFIILGAAKSATTWWQHTHVIIHNLKPAK